MNILQRVIGYSHKITELKNFESSKSYSFSKEQSRLRRAHLLGSGLPRQQSCPRIPWRSPRWPWHRWA